MADFARELFFGKDVARAVLLGPLHGHTHHAGARPDALQIRIAPRSFGCDVSFLSRVRLKRSTTCRLSLAKLPARSNHARPFRPVTSTTSVSPSHLPLEVPIQVSDPASTGLPMFTSRLALAYSYTNRMSLFDCTI